MFSIRKSVLPPNTLLSMYAENNAYVDCYWTDVSGNRTLSEYIFAFYTTPLFRVERAILAVSVSKPSTDEQARQLAQGARDSFAAWSVENRSEHQILMCDFVGRTRSWLMVVPGKESSTRLYFGSAVVPIRDPRTGKTTIGLGYRALLGFHQVYSVLLLYAAKQRLKIQSSTMGNVTI